MPNHEISAELKIVLGSVIALYVLLMFAISSYAQKKIKNEEDYVVAGRKLPLYMTWATLLATWFGAGTLLTASNEVARDGLRKAAIDPFGAGLCLILAGLFFARPLWNMGLLTLSDFFGRKYGDRAEIVSALLMVPSFFGWVAAQFVALAGLLQMFFGLPLELGIFLVALVGTGYTLVGGMWSVTLTDAVQITLVIIGLVILTVHVFMGLGHGHLLAGLETVFSSLSRESPDKLVLIPVETRGQFLAWLSVLCAGALGNLPGQDLMQRVFSARSAKVAQKACLYAGIAYLLLGTMPILLGLAAASSATAELGESVIPALAHAFMHPLIMIIFVVVIMSAVLSSIDSAILSPATVLAQNLLGRLSCFANSRRISKLALNRLCVVLVALCSLLTAYSGTGAYGLLENSYSLSMVGLFVPLACGLLFRNTKSAAALASMLVGIGLWLPQYLMGWSYFLEVLPVFANLELSLALTCTCLSFAAYLLGHYFLDA